MTLCFLHNSEDLLYLPNHRILPTSSQFPSFPPSLSHPPILSFSHPFSLFRVFTGQCHPATNFLKPGLLAFLLTILTIRTRTHTYLVLVVRDGEAEAHAEGVEEREDHPAAVPGRVRGRG